MNTNGIISFLGAVSQYTPAPFSLGDNRRLISPFWGDMDTRNGGTALYRESIAGPSYKGCSTRIHRSQEILSLVDFHGDLGQSRIL